MLRRIGKAEWRGNGTEGRGALSTVSKALKDVPFTFQSRFHNESGRNGTNPEELIAAAHAACFSMAFSAQLTRAGHTPLRISTEAIVFLEQVADRYQIERIQLSVDASVPGIAPSEFQRIAANTKETCPVSQALESVPIELEAQLSSETPRKGASEAQVVLN